MVSQSFRAKPPTLRLVVAETASAACRRRRSEEAYTSCVQYVPDGGGIAWRFTSSLVSLAKRGLSRVTRNSRYHNTPTIPKLITTATRPNITNSPESLSIGASASCELCCTIATHPCSPTG